jgi:putative membrane protein
MSRLGWQVFTGGALLAILLLVLNLASSLGWGHTIGLGSSMMGLWMLIFWVVIIGGIVELAQLFARSLNRSSIPPQGKSAIDILKKRYSRGEITKEQFEGMKHDLGL